MLQEFEEKGLHAPQKKNILGLQPVKRQGFGLCQPPPPWEPKHLRNTVQSSFRDLVREGLLRVDSKILLQDVLGDPRILRKSK